MAKVSLQKCPRYDKDQIKAAIELGLSQIGFPVSAFREAKVALKPNLLIASFPEKAIITHPVFVRAVAEVVKDHGGRPVLVESPPFTPLPKMISKVGYADFVQELGLEVARDWEAATLTYEAARRIKRIEISKAYFEADIIINLPKFKTHGCTYVSASVKNLFGALPGLTKSKMHLRFPENDDFAEWLLDLSGAFIRGFDPPKKILHIVDAIVGQEGEGPGPAGTPRPIGVIVMGQDPVAVDYVAVRVVGLDPGKVPTIARAWAREFCVSSPEEIEVLGERIADVRLENFVPTRATISSHFMRGSLVGPRVKNWVMERPVPAPEKCALCYQCQSICPAGAIAAAGPGRRAPRYDYRKCIRCFCCLEICPEAAISLRRGKLQWIVEARLREGK